MIIVILFFGNAKGQTYDESYAYTVFAEDFNGTSLNRAVWRAENSLKRSIGLLKDSSATLRVQNGNLELTMISCPNCSADTYHGDYAGAEVVSLEGYRFRYGVFECRAKFAHQNASWPAFWLIGRDDLPCSQGGIANEIDMAELKCDDNSLTIDHVIHKYYAPDQCDGEQKDIYHYPGMNFDNNFHLFKCVWSPEKITYYVDNTQTYQVLNNGQDWYPCRFLNIYLSQQVIDPLGSPVVPQTTYFDYVKVKQFFNAPNITIINTSCTSTTVTLDVDDLATNITWQVTPASLFVSLSGTGKVANITKASNVSGLGKISYTFQMPSGESFSAEKDIWVGVPVVDFITGDDHVDSYGMAIYEAELVSEPQTTYLWSVEPSGTVYNYGKTASIYFQGDNDYRVYVTASNACGDSETAVHYVGVGSYWPYIIFPNPGDEIIQLQLGQAETPLKSADTTKRNKKPETYDIKILNDNGILVKTMQKKKLPLTIKTSDLPDGKYILQVLNNRNLQSKQILIKHN